MKTYTYKGITFDVYRTCLFTKMGLHGTEYTVKNGDLKTFFVADVGGNRSFGRNSASAIRGAEKLIDNAVEKVDKETRTYFNAGLVQRRSTTDPIKY